jgi:hypothetical protein
MKHPINLTPMLICAAVVLTSSGCGDSNAEKAAKERETRRLEIEKQAAREQQQGNKAVSDIEKKIGRKARSLDLNLPEEKKAVAPPSTAPKT